MYEMERNHTIEIDKLQKEIIKLTKELNTANINSTTNTLQNFKQMELNSNYKMMFEKEKKRVEDLETVV